jgi:hypothetical protein
MHVERYQTTHFLSTGREEQDFVFTMSLIKDICFLALGGDDIAVAFEGRFRAWRPFPFHPSARQI